MYFSKLKFLKYLIYYLNTSPLEFWISKFSKKHLYNYNNSLNRIKQFLQFLQIQ